MTNQLLLVVQQISIQGVVAFQNSEIDGGKIV
jgi:hypothetical protein